MARRMRSTGGPTPGSAAADQADADPEQVARAIALRRLTAAPRTRAELRGDLVARGVDPVLAARVVDRFTEVGLLDDAEYARMWVDSRRRTRGTAHSLLRRELRHKGVGDDDAQAALASLDPAAERARALRLVETRLAATATLDPARRTRRLAGLLIRRGYPAGVAYSVVRDALGSDDYGSDDYGSDDC